MRFLSVPHMPAISSADHERGFTDIGQVKGANIKIKNILARFSINYGVDYRMLEFYNERFVHDNVHLTPQYQHERVVMYRNVIIGLIIGFYFFKKIFLMSFGEKFEMI